MKEFFGNWVCLTLMFMMTVYTLAFGFVSVFAFAVWSVSPFHALLNEIDWISFRVIVGLSTFMGLVLSTASLGD